MPPNAETVRMMPNAAFDSWSTRRTNTTLRASAPTTRKLYVQPMTSSDRRSSWRLSQVQPSRRSARIVGSSLRRRARSWSRARFVVGLRRVLSRARYVPESVNTISDAARNDAESSANGSDAALGEQGRTDRRAGQVASHRSRSRRTVRWPVRSARSRPGSAGSTGPSCRRTPRPTRAGTRRPRSARRSRCRPATLRWRAARRRCSGRRRRRPSPAAGRAGRPPLRRAGRTSATADPARPRGPR